MTDETPTPTRNGRPRAERWAKDGAWHALVPHTPTEFERRAFPRSYPPGDAGPFYVWAERTFDCEGDALAFARDADEAAAAAG